MLSILKKITAGIAAAAICAVPLTPLQVMAEPSSDDAAVVTFGKYIRTKNVKNWEFNLWDNAERVVRDGREGVKFAKDKQTYHFMIDVDDKFIPPSKDGTDVQVEVDYFDESPVDGNSFNVRYTSKDYDISDAAGLCYLENTGKWQTHTFILKDALFNKKMDGMNGKYDLSISEWNRYAGSSAADIVFGEIRIKPLPEKVLTATMTTDYPGNIFGGDEAKEFKLNLKNRRSTSVVTKIKAEAFDYMEGTPIIQPEKMNQNLVASAEKEVTVDKELDTSITLNLPKYGSYSIKITLDCTDETGYNRTQTIENYFSVMNKYSDEEEKNERIGVSAHFQRLYENEPVSLLDLSGRSYAEYFAQEISYIGFGYLRTDWYQTMFQKSSGEMFYPPYDGASNLLAKYNIKTYPILQHWIEVAGNARTDDKALQTYVDFCVDMVSRHKEIPVFEIDNEVNAHYTTDEWIRIMKAVYTAVKAARPDANLFGLAYAGSNYGWLEEFLAKGGGEYMDGISIHLYDDSGTFDRHWWYEKLPQLKEILVKYGMDKKPLWFSEQGWSTYEGGPTTEWDRTVSNVKYWTFLMAEEWTDHFMIYNAIRKGSGITDRENMFGMFREEDDMVAPLAPLPVCVSLNAMNRMLNKTEAIDQIIADNDMAALYRFKYADNSQVISAWSDEGNRNVCLNLGTDKITVYDVYGNETDTLYSDNGIFELALTYAPQYFKGNITKFEKAEPTLKINNRITAAVDDDAVIDMGNNSADIKIEVESELESVVEKNKITFKCPADKLGDNNFTLRVYANGRLYYSGTGTVTIVNPLTADMKYEYKDNNDFKGSVSVKNISNREIFATVNIELPDYDYYNSNNNVVRLKPGEEKQYAVRLPNLSEVRIMKTNINMTLDNGYSFMQTDSDTLTYAKYTAKKPTIDGKMSVNEWNAVWFCSDTADHWKLGKEWKGKDDLSFKGNLMWDNEALYMAIDVTDDTHTQPFTGVDIWHSDGMQFGFSNVMPPYPADTQKFEEFQIGLSDDGILTVQRLQSACGKATGDCLDKINAAVTQKGTHTIYEAAIPWTEIFGDDYTVSEDSVVRFGLIVNDTDNDSPRGYMHYNDGIGSGKNYKQFEPIILIK